MIDFVCDDVLHWAENYRGPKFHAALLDPPAGIRFMNMAFDHDHGGRDAWIAHMQEIFTAMAQHLHPGAHCIVWALPRTSHWTATALENAGLEIRDICTHVFGSGFPKSQNISKVIDRKAGMVGEVIGRKTDVSTGRPMSEKQAAQGRKGESSDGWDRPWRADSERLTANCMITAPATDAARTWNGWGSSLKPASEHWIICRKPLAGTIAETCMEYGSGSLNIDAGRISASSDDPNSRPNCSKRPQSATPEQVYAGGWNGKQENGYGSEFTSQGRFPANFCLSHSPQCEYVGVKRVKGCPPVRGKYSNGSVGGILNAGHERENDFNGHADADGNETVSEWKCVESCPVHILGLQSGESKSSTDPNRFKGHKRFDGTKYAGDEYSLKMERGECATYADSGSSARFFANFDFSLDQQEAIDQAAPFYYAAKASRGERDKGLEDMPETIKHAAYGEFAGTPEHATNGNGKQRNIHPTVKPLKLGIYLCKLLSIPDAYAPRRLLNPFCGSGSEAISGMLSGGFDEIVAIDFSPEYIELARKRAAYWAAQQVKEQQPILLTPELERELFARSAKAISQITRDFFPDSEAQLILLEAE